MGIKFISTRGGNEEISGSKAIIQGLAGNKGLFVPTEIPSLEDIGINLSDAPDYRSVAKKVIGGFFDDFTAEEIAYCVDNAYDSKFAAQEIVPVVKAGDGCFLELYHGKTSAFKDMALSILPYLLTTSVKKQGETDRICILTATSGDTGKAALEGFSDVPGTEIIVFYPDQGVSDVQKAQMVTQGGANTHVFAIKGNFDDAQTAVKKIFNDDEIRGQLAERQIKFSSANSINVGRLVPQIAYYVYGYLCLVASGAIKAGDEINIVVPTGNFGNILAAYYAHLMGLPVNKFICASNENKILTDFINTGIYDTRREFYLTNSPSMDILISSNLERLLFLLSGGDGAAINDLMAKLETEKCYEVDSAIKEGMKKFYGGFTDAPNTNAAIGKMWAENEYLLDTHTAVAYRVYKEYRESAGDDTTTLIASTASPFKFAGSVAKAIGLPACDTDFQYVEELSRATGWQIPKGLKDLDKKEVRFNKTIDQAEMAEAVLKSL